MRGMKRVGISAWLALVPLFLLGVAACSGDDDSVGNCGSALVRLCSYNQETKAWDRDCHMACPSTTCADGQVRQSCEWDSMKQQFVRNCVIACQK